MSRRRKRVAVTDDRTRTPQIGALLGVGLGLAAVAVGVAETLSYVGSAPPGLLIATGLLLALSEAANVRHTLAEE